MFKAVLPDMGGTIEVYPERDEPMPGWFDRAGIALTGRIRPFSRPKPERFGWIVGRVRDEAPSMQALDDHEILPLAQGLGRQLRRKGFTDPLVGRAFALIREIADRRLGMRHFDVQLMGGLVLLNGMVAEMETGEGKTLTATLAAGTAALAGIPVHVITVNDYLADRDAEEMGPVYAALGLSVGVIKQGMAPQDRRRAYSCSITYCTNKEVAFDYLKDRIVLWDRPGPVRLQLEKLFGQGSRIGRLLMRGLHFGIVDEADSVLVDEARTPLIISGDSGGTTEEAVYREAFSIARDLSEPDNYRVYPEDHAVELTDEGRAAIEQKTWDQARGWTTPGQREELIRQSLAALSLYVLDKHYLVRDGKVQIIDEYTGRTMPDRSWERGLHQLIEIKEGCEVTTRKDTKARISYQKFFRRYMHLSGMTGTAREITGELWSIYSLPVVTIPTNRPLKRTYLGEQVFATEEQKWRAVRDEVGKVHDLGRPVLVGTRSVAASEHLSALLSEAGLEHRVLNARQDKEEAMIVARAGQEGSITVATNMAGRGTDIKLGKNVAGLGGLHVIATERHDARRIDRQLFGRSGRQGDPGTCIGLVALEDELMTVHAGKALSWCAKILKGPGEWKAGWMGTLLFHLAQRSAERSHARIRKNLLKMDEQLGDALAFSGRSE